MEMLTLDNPPKIFPLKLLGLRANSDGYYLYSDFLQRLNDSIDAYDKLKDL